MKNLKIVFLAILAAFALPICGYSQTGEIVEEEIIDGEVVSTQLSEASAAKRFSLSGTADASMFQMAILELGNKQQFSTLRYTLFFNTGFNVNYQVSKSVQLFSGLGIKNLGLIYRTDSLVQKYRTYTFGAPIGLKIGDLRKEYFIIGGGVDVPFHYKKKQWVKGDRSTKIKAREWFSDEVNPIFAYAFLGYRFSNSLTTKIFYYPTNFWSGSFVPGNRSNIFMLTLGFDLQSKIKDKSVVFGQN